MRKTSMHQTKGVPVRGLPRGPRDVSEEDLRALDAIAACEPHEPVLAPWGWPSPTRYGAPKRRGSYEWLVDWTAFLRDHGHACAARAPERGGTVPAWVNALATMVSTQHPDYPANTPPCVEYNRPHWLTRHAEAVRLARRAVRAAARSPLFRARLADEVARLRREVGVTSRCYDHLLRWLRERDWSDCRPGNGDEAPKAEGGRT